MTLLEFNSLNNKILHCGLILILILLLFSCTDQSPAVYTITFDPNGGTLNGKQSVIVVEGMPVPEPEAPTRSGYIFDGWYSDANTSIPYDFDTPVTSSFTLYAKWTPVTSSFTLYAKWTQITYTVTFDANLPDGVDAGEVSGMPTSINNIPYGGTAEKPENPTIKGYQFDGWYSDVDTSIPYDFDTPVTSSFTLYAKWTAKTWTVTFLSDGGTVTFLSDGGTEIDSQSVVNCNRAVKPDDPEKEGYAFEGWYIQGTDTEYDFTLPVTSNLTLEARWSQYYTVTFDVNIPDGVDAGEVSGMPIPINCIPSGETAKKPENPTIAGYQFEGWYSDADTSIPYDFDTPVTSSFTLYAKWTAKTWTITFLSDGGTEIDSQSVVNCNKAVKPDNPEKEGYTFEGWYSDTDTSIPYDFNSPVIADITLYAKWTQITYTVTFDANLPDGVDAGDVSGMPESINNIPYGETVGEKTDPTLYGYVFKGWYRTENSDVAEEAFDLASEPVLKNLMLYAKWSKEATVTFDPNGGSLTGETEKTVPYGGKLTELPADPDLEKLGNTYIFIGWYVDGEPFDLSKPITSDMTIEAKWSDSYFNTTGYFVYDAEGLNAWAKAAKWDMDLNCTLKNNINLPDASTGESNWTAVDPSLGYTGTFDGNGKTITNLAGSQGMFGFIGEGGTVKSLTLENVRISGGYSTGAIAGTNHGTIENCSISGNIKGSTDVGGVCGFNNGSKGKITDCHFSGYVEGTENVGGLCGENFYYCTITACYSTGSVKGEYNVGGICGTILERGTITACYSTGSVEGKGNVGGVCGKTGDDTTITACYSTGSVEGNTDVGGICGNSGGYYSNSMITACYWSVPSTTSSLRGIGFGKGEATEVDEYGITWNSAMTAMNNAIGRQNRCEYAENTNPDTSVDMPLVLVQKK